MPAALIAPAIARTGAVARSASGPASSSSERSPESARSALSDCHGTSPTAWAIASTLIAGRPNDKPPMISPAAGSRSSSRTIVATDSRHTTGTRSTSIRAGPAAIPSSWRAASHEGLTPRPANGSKPGRRMRTRGVLHLVAPDPHEVLGIRFVGHDRILEETEPGLLVRPDRAHVLDRGTDDALGHVVGLEDDVAEEPADDRRAMAIADEVGFADYKDDPGGRHVERERLAVLVVVVDPVGLDETDRPAAQADEEELCRVVVIAADAPAVLLELVGPVRLARRSRPPTAVVPLDEPGSDPRKVRFGQRREVVLRRIR